MLNRSAPVRVCGSETRSGKCCGPRSGFDRSARMIFRSSFVWMLMRLMSRRAAHDSSSLATLRPSPRQDWLRKRVTELSTSRVMCLNYLTMGVGVKQLCR
ncbi:MAG: hypothetical protein DWI10_08600 [Planctomycetota bacterium]|nr:MAG: hypothetical protein DWI10_08600 [Planctomycetota bacterium]